MGFLPCFLYKLFGPDVWPSRLAREDVVLGEGKKSVIHFQQMHFLNEAPGGLEFMFLCQSNWYTACGKPKDMQI